MVPEKTSGGTLPDLIGQSLGRYHILEQLGEGGMATVYKAYDTRLERDVAVKVIRVDQFGSAVLERILKRFEREAKALARLTHPNIVHVNDFGDQDGIPYLVMDYLPGGTLKQQMGKPMPWQDAVKLLLPVADALEYAHSQGIIHRDVKPSNILLTQHGQPMLTDFGIAKILEIEDTQTQTGTGMGVGTPEYMAPEQWIGQATLQSDIYSLGVIFYELVTGRKPFLADTPAAILLKQLNDPLPRPGQYVYDLPENVENTLLKALTKKLEHRYQTMSEFAEALENLFAGQNLTSQPMGSSATQKTRVEDSMATIEQTVTRDELPPADQSPSLTNLPPSNRRKQWIRSGIGVVGLILVLIGSGFAVSSLLMHTPSTMSENKLMPSPTLPMELASLTPAANPTFTPGPIQASGLRIAYIENGILTIRDGDQAVLSQINIGYSPEAILYWAPNGKYVLVAASWNSIGNKFVYLVDLDNQTVTPWSGLPASALHFNWSPQSDRISIAYVTPVAEGRWSADIVSIYGTNIVPEFSGQNINIWPQWSPDGRYLVYLRQIEAVDNPFHIIKIDPDTGTTQDITPSDYSRGLMWGSDLTWLTDGRLVVRPLGEPRLDALDPNTFSTTPIFNIPVSGEWERILLSPSNARVAYTVKTGDASYSLYISNLDGTGFYQAYQTNTFPYAASWSPDEQSIYLSSVDAGLSYIYQLDTNKMISAYFRFTDPIHVFRESQSSQSTYNWLDSNNIILTSDQGLNTFSLTVADRTANQVDDLCTFDYYNNFCAVWIP
jgi:serine/threonine protein kinase/Tol biopolymer transport system component